MYDVAIVGAGPAGCAAALSLARLDPGLQLCIVAEEPSHYMGQTLAPGAQRLLQQLGCWESFVGQGFQPSYATCALWGSPEPYDHHFLFGMHGNGWHVERGRFDVWLRSCLPRYVDVIDALPQARFVIDASGRGASFATQAGAKRNVLDSLTAVGCCLSGEPLSGAMVEAEAEGWWYSAPAGSGVMVAFFTDADVVRREGLRDGNAFLQRLRTARFTAEQLPNIQPVTPQVWPAASQRLHTVYGDAWLAVGDAASAFDPLSSAGVVKALRSGLLGSFAALDWLRGRHESLQRYSRLVAAEFEDYLKTRTYYYGLERRWPDSNFWLRRHSSVAVAMPSLHHSTLTS